MKRLLLSRPLPRAVEERAQSEFDTEVRRRNAPLSVDEMKFALADFDMIMPSLGDAFDAEIFAAVAKPRCRLLANFGAGYNHIDVQAARDHGIAVTNTPGAVTDATADVALLLMLMTARRAGEGERLVRSGLWSGWHPTQLLGLHITGRCLGIVGLGRVGRAIARRAHFGFDMEIRYTSRTQKTLNFPAAYHDNLVELAAASDVLVIAVPGSTETHHLIGYDVLRAMPQHAVLVNVARGDVVDEQELINALKTNMIAGAGLDVYEHEPQVPPELILMDNVTLLPHLGTAALEVRTNMGMMAIENCIAFADDKPLINPV